MYYFSEDTLKILLSVMAGALIGIEREYRSKAAGFRTMTLICIGSCIFTLVSIKLGGVNNADRIAANIITGIGFLGAGVVFKDGFSVIGLTTATAIWVTASLGMAIGMGAYKMTAEGLLLVLLILSAFEYIQNFIDRLHQKKTYKIVFDKTIMKTGSIEKELLNYKLDFTKIKETKTFNDLVCSYEIYGSSSKFERFNAYLLNSPDIKSFEY